MRQPVDPRHRAIREKLRVVGPAIVVVGLIFTVIGIGNFFASFGGFEPPRYFWCAFIGLPLVGIGMAISKFAFLGAVTRYMANEVAPVGKDVVNCMADGTKGAVRDLAAAISDGLRSGGAEADVTCQNCNTVNEESANYCKNCGAALLKSKPCPDCRALNDPDARFCDNCGRAIE